MANGYEKGAARVSVIRCANKAIDVAWNSSAPESRKIAYIRAVDHIVFEHDRCGKSESDALREIAALKM